MRLIRPGCGSHWERSGVMQPRSAAWPPGESRMRHVAHLAKETDEPSLHAMLRLRAELHLEFARAPQPHAARGAGAPWIEEHHQSHCRRQILDPREIRANRERQ